MSVNLKNIIGNINVEKGTWANPGDPLAVALASYFEGHPDRPADDPVDPEFGWGEWVLKKTDEALENIAREVVREWKKDYRRKDDALTTELDKTIKRIEEKIPLSTNWAEDGRYKWPARWTLMKNLFNNIRIVKGAK